MKKYVKKPNRLMRKILSTVLITVLAFGLVLPAAEKDTVYAKSKEERGLWLAFSDYATLGLAGKSEKVFTENIRRVLKQAEYYGVTSIYFHVRSHDDAAWKSATFKPNMYLSPTGKASGIAADVYKYDPLKIVIRETHARKMKLHAWMNPYRITPEYYLDPAKQSTTDRINLAVAELLEYDIDGIHMDDYFYSASKGYRTVDSSKKYKVSISAKKKRANCNAMVRSVYNTVHEKKGVVFGISPAGNYENCMNMGADVDTWMSVPGYLDYIAPQIYWTDNWGSKGKTKMFTDRMTKFISLNKINLPMYVGLAIYRTGYAQSDDKGWGMRNTNIRTQVKQLRSAGLQGYILFTAPDLFDKNSAKERYYLKGLVKPVKAKKIAFKKKTVTMYTGTKKKVAIVYTPSDTNPKTVTYTSSNPAKATVSKSGIVKAKKPGKVTIKAKTLNGKTAKYKITIKKAKKKKAKKK
jgi:uncharacterized lipoprotein YddW (UPF0748 family)